MELSTRCPECGTVFPVSLEQLQLRKGYIRCIQCANIFDGFEEAVPVDGPRAAAYSISKPTGPAALPEQARPISTGGRPAQTVGPAQPFSVGAGEPALPQPAKPFSIGGGEQTLSEPARPFSIGPEEDPAGETVRPFSIGTGKQPVNDNHDPFIISGRGARVEPHQDEPRLGPRIVAEGRPGAPRPRIAESQLPPRGERPLIAPSAGDDDVDADADDFLYVEPRNARRSERYQPAFMAESRRSRSWMTTVWALLTLCGLVLLAAQGVYVYRAQLANTFPDLRPLLERGCQELGCMVPYDRRIEAIAITGSALRSGVASADDVSKLTLEVTLRNTFERPQEWPTLVLDLKDASGTVVVRRNLGPNVWVPAELRDGPFAANSELRVQIPVSVRGLQVNGYQLDKFFP